MKYTLPVDCKLNMYQPGFCVVDMLHWSSDGLNHLFTLKSLNFLFDSVVYVIPTSHFVESVILSGVSIRNRSCKFLNIVSFLVSFSIIIILLVLFLFEFFLNRIYDTYLRYYKKIVDSRDVNHRVSSFCRPLFHKISDRNALSEIELIFRYRRLKSCEQLFRLYWTVSTWQTSIITSLVCYLGRSKYLYII